MFPEIFDHAPVAMILVGPDRKIDLVNQEAAQLFGYTKEELMGHPIELLVPDESRAKHPALVGGYLAHPTNRAMGKGRNLHGRRKDGSLVPIEVGLKSVPTERGLFILSSIIDISERTRAEEKFRAAFEGAPNAMIMVDESGRIVLVNEQTVHLFGYSREELLSQTIQILVPQATRPHHPGYLASYMKHPEPRAMGTGRVLYAQKKDGSLFPVEIGLRPFRGADATYVIGSVVDISELEKARRNLTARNEELEQFAYRTSHDLKAPLISIAGLAKFIGEDIEGGDLPEAKLNSEKIVAISGRLQSLISDILRLMKADTLTETKEPVDFVRLVESCRENLALPLEEREVDLRTRFAHSAPLIAPRTRVQQLIENLVSNAVKYSNPNRSDRFVEIRTRDSDRGLSLEIEDNGLGIPENRKAEVFGLFKRFHAESYGGSGLGLYLVRKHVEKLDGSIDFDSAPGTGTTFRVWLPHSTESAAENQGSPVA